MEPVSDFTFNFNLRRYTETQHAAHRGVLRAWRGIGKKVKRFRAMAKHVALKATKHSRARYTPVIVVAMFSSDGTFLYDPSSAPWAADPAFEEHCRKAAGIPKGKGKRKKKFMIF